MPTLVSCTRARALWPLCLCRKTHAENRQHRQRLAYAAETPVILTRSGVTPTALAMLLDSCCVSCVLLSDQDEDCDCGTLNVNETDTTTPLPASNT